jgi:hypothetical protein
MGLMWNVWYLDDGILVGDPARLGVALEFLDLELKKRGLSINRKKCVIWGPAGPAIPNTDGIHITPWVPGTGITVLGTPIAFPGTTDHVDREWASRLESMEEAANKLTRLADKQMAHHLLRFCLDALQSHAPFAIH